MAVKNITIQRYSYGISLQLPSGLNLQGATAMEVEIRPPSGEKIVKNLSASAIVSGTNDLLVPIIDTDFTEAGIYDYQIKNVSPGRVVYGPIKQIQVLSNLTYVETV